MIKLLPRANTLQVAFPLEQVRLMWIRDPQFRDTCLGLGDGKDRPYVCHHLIQQC